MGLYIGQKDDTWGGPLCASPSRGTTPTKASAGYQVLSAAADSTLALSSSQPPLLSLGALRAPPTPPDLVAGWSLRGFHSALLINSAMGLLPYLPLLVCICKDTGERFLK